LLCFQKVRKEFIKFSKGESGNTNLTNVDMKDWFIAPLHLVLNVQAALVVGIFNFAVNRGLGEAFTELIKRGRMRRKLLLVNGRLKVKFSERGFLV